MNTVVRDSCVLCGQTIEVDAAKVVLVAKPDAVDLLGQGSRRIVPCPRCGHLGERPTPLEVARIMMQSNLVRLIIDEGWIPDAPPEETSA